MIEIKFDQSTLPKDGQKVEWQTYEDYKMGIWTKGIYIKSENLFLEGFKETGLFYFAQTVMHWKPLG